MTAVIFSMLPRNMSLKRACDRGRVGARAPQLRLLDAALHPDREERGQHADEEHGAPSEARTDERVDHRRRGESDRPGALHEAEHAAAKVRRPCLRDERRSGGPHASHAEAEQRAKDGELPQRLRETACAGEDRVDQHRAHQRLRSAEAVGDVAEDQPANGGAEKGDGAERAGLCLRQTQVSDDVGQRQREKHDVERVEAPRHGRRDESALAVERSGAPPAEQAGMVDVYRGCSRHGFARRKVASGL